MPNWKKVIVSGSDAALNSLNVTNSLTASGIIYPTVDGTSNQVIKTDGNGNLFFDNVITTTISIKNVSGTTIAKGTPCYITGSGTSGNLAGVWPADASNPLRMPAGVIAGETLIAGAEGVGLLNGFINGVDTSAFAAGDSVYVAVGGGYTNVKPTGSSVLIQKLGNVEKSAINGSGVINGPGYYNEVPNIQQGYTWVGNNNGVAVAVTTSSIQNVVSSSFASTSSFLNSTTNAFIQNGNSFGTQALLGTNDNQNLALETSGSIRMFISSSGNVGIGTTTPGVALDVAGNIRSNSTIFTSQTQTQTIRINSSTHLAFQNTGSGEVARFDNAGNWGIGTTSPNSKLDVNGNTTITGSLAVSQSLLQYSNITSVTSGSTSNVASFSTGSYTAAFFDYVTTSGTSARAGSVFTVWNGNNVEYTETSTNDIGNTNNLVLSASLSAGAIRLQATSLSGSWSVKTLARMI